MQKNQHEKDADFSFHITWQNQEFTEIWLSTIAALTVYHALKADMRHPLWHKTSPVTTVQFSGVFPERPLEFLRCHLVIKKLENAALYGQTCEWDEWGCLFFFLIAESTRNFSVWIKVLSTKNQNSIIANVSVACKLPMLGCQHLLHQIGLGRTLLV